MNCLRGQRVCEAEEKQQVPPLRFAPVGMTILLQGMAQKRSDE
jgi:hypothetical protein